jgi:hypothetical protein
VVEDHTFRNGSVEAAWTVMRAVGAYGPETISGIRQNIQGIELGEGRGRSRAATFIYEGTLGIGEAPSEAFSIFVVASEEESRFMPVVAWYQREGSGGKAFPRLLAAHDVRGSGVPDLILEVFGEEARWLSILGDGETGWQFVYQDPCAQVTTPETLRVFP